MYKLVVISDIHRDLTRLARLVPIINSADCLIFCGDGVSDIMRLRGQIIVPMVCVRGNNDWDSQHKIDELASVNLGGVKALVTHGHRLNVRNGLSSIVNVAQHKGCALAFFGHTHKFCDVVVGGVHCINPGAVCNGSYALVAGEGGKFVCRQTAI